MNRPKQQHIVPKVYLRNFCDSNNKNQIYFFDKINKKTELTNIDNVAKEKGFYTDLSKEDNEYYEKFYSTSVEPKLGHLLSHILIAATMYYNDAPLISDDQRLLLSKMLVFQMLRTRNARELLREKAKFVADRITTEVLKMLISINRKDLLSVVEKYRTLDDEVFRELAFPATIDESRLKKYCSLIDAMICVFYDNKTDIDFITSDNPVIIKRLSAAAPKDIGIGVAGLGNIDCILAYPINPRLAAVLFHRAPLIDSAFSEYENKRHPIVQSEIVQTFNRWHLQQATRQVYSRTALCIEKF